ncbi:MAG: hypothetical protein COA78_20055 [Blastopirellula sp.]|nr:MAG: hypothetical protein COA78_20055 [Blastopirellula sp.]
MDLFKKVLVGVDLSFASHLASDELSEPNQEAIDRGIQFAKENEAELHLQYSMDLNAKTIYLIEQSDSDSFNVVDQALEVLKKIAAKAESAGIHTTYSVKFGKPWVELIRTVTQDGFEVVVIGTKHHNIVGESLLGSTGQRLLRYCPCPVFVVQPHQGRSGVLVATDFSEVADTALDYGALAAKLRGEDLHVLHVIESHRDIPILKELMGLESHEEVEGKLAVEAAELMQLCVNRPAVQECGKEPIVTIAQGDPGSMIQEVIEQENIDLLCIGTIARSGISGVLLGNSAEKLMRNVTCSLLALKPKDFKTTIR